MLTVRTYWTLGLAFALSVSFVSGEPARADQAEVLQQLAQSRAKYATAEAWAERRKELRQAFLEGAKLWPLPERPPVKAIVRDRREYKDYSVENVALETLPGFYCTGNLYRPLGRKDVGPAILSPHGHFRPLGRFRESQQIRCAHLARMGATVFSYSMVGWQDAMQTTHDDPLVLARQTWNSLRAVDFLTSLERVDPNRVGITGASGGGTQSFFLTLIDDRIKASAPLVIVYPWAAPEGCLCEGGMPVMQAAQTNAIELAAAAAPRPQLLVSVGNDPTQNFPVEGFPFIRAMYEVAGAAEQVENVHLADEAHDFGPTKRELVYDFFARHFGLGPDGFAADAKQESQPGEAPPEDLAKITLETPEQLAVFDQDTPLPEHAIRGSEAVTAAFTSYLAELRSTTEPRDKKRSLLDYPFAEYGFKVAQADDEALLFTAPGFAHVGEPRTAQGPDRARLKLRILDAAGNPTACRVNVVGPDGHYYEPADHPLKLHSLTGQWPKSGWGNRPGKAPIRYFGRYFYTTGQAEVEVPAGTVRIEVWKGFEHKPVTRTVLLSPRETQSVEMTLHATAAMAPEGYWSGDPHIHIQRRGPEDEQQILDLMQAEDIHVGTILAYNEPVGAYEGYMTKMDAPQLRGVGRRSTLTRGTHAIVSGQEYRSSTYGHMNLFWLDELVLNRQSLNANNWPPFGLVARAAREFDGIAFYAHGGYAQEIYADVVQGNIDGVELLQFGVYRGIGLVDWYHMLNSGFRVPANGASDYPACRKLGDCKTYVYHEGAKETPSVEAWLRGMADGRSFFTTGPLLLLEVDGHQPGHRLEFDGPRQVKARVRVRSEVAPVTHLQLIANGRILREMRIPAEAGQGDWIELDCELNLEESAWIAARAFSLSATGSPDAEAHTNPVYVYLDGKTPYYRPSLDRLVEAIDGQIAKHKKRDFPEQSRVINYFERSRDILMKIRDAEGAPAAGHPADWADVATTSFDPGQRTHSDEELRAFLKPVPPQPVAEAVQSFETVAGFEMQPVAREPQVRDPICAAFDENGNLFVGEMCDYPFKPAEGGRPIGSVRMLTDNDGDGVFDESHVFADELLWVGGIAPWKGGVYVAAPPDIWYLKDTDGDHRADVRRRVYTGFGTKNQQAMLNNLAWGLDQRIYGSTAGNGGVVQHVDSKATNREPVSVDGRDFRFDPRTEEFEAITGTVQFGNSFDDWGNRFLCSESRPLLHAVLPQRYLIRNPYLPVPTALHHLTDGPVPVNRISPLERWRMIRSSRRIAHGARSADAAGASHHVIDAAAGVTVYRGGAYPAEYYGNVFIGGAQNNLVHRRKLIPDGVTFRSERADAGTEFVRSSDNWFRPVNFINAPDGTLYVLDMSREVLESIHVPLDVARFLDFTSGRSHGRIYRLAPPGFRVPAPPQLGQADAGQLVEAFESPHGWWRDTAHRLLYERQETSITPTLRRMMRQSTMPQARLLALRTLHGLGTLSDDDLAAALQDAHEAVCEHAMQLAETRLDSAPELRQRVIAFTSDPRIRLRFQAAFSLGESRSPEAAAALVQLARQAGDDRWMRTAILSSAGSLADRMLFEFLEQPEFLATPQGRQWVTQLASIIGARNRRAELRLALEAVALEADRSGSNQLADHLVRTIGAGLKRSGGRFEADGTDARISLRMMQRIYRESKATAMDSEADLAARNQAIAMLSCFSFSVANPILNELLDVRQPGEVRSAAIAALADYPDDQVATQLLGSWRTYSPELREAATESLLGRIRWTRRFLESALRGEVSLAGLTEQTRTQLRNHKDSQIRLLAEELFGDPPPERAAILADYQSIFNLPADADNGQKVFLRDCAACHRLGTTGHPVGPDLGSSPSRDPRALLGHILIPNQYVLPKYETYVAVDSSGRMYSGMIAARTATSITLRRAEKQEDTLLRTNIDELYGTGQSLMPEGFEKKISKQEMADLLEFLEAAGPSAASAEAEQPVPPPKLDIGTLPGLVEPTD